jgi:hypothetical protein
MNIVIGGFGAINPPITIPPITVVVVIIVIIVYCKNESPYRDEDQNAFQINQFFSI